MHPSSAVTYSTRRALTRARLLLSPLGSPTHKQQGRGVPDGLAGHGRCGSEGRDAREADSGTDDLRPKPT